MLRIGSWCVDPSKGLISRDGEHVRLEARGMRLLLYLAEHPGEVVSTDDLLSHVWSGVAVTQDSVYQAVASLRRLLGDDPKQPAYIATVPRLGYRLVAEVASCTEAQPVAAAPLAAAPKHRRKFLWIVALAAVACVANLWVLSRIHAHMPRNGPTGNSATGNGANGSAVAPAQQSVAVLPFLDLTPGMKEGEFTDGMTEELIDRLSRVPGLKVPPPTSSFYFKDKQVPLAEMARSLGVAYVVDGSVRESGGQLRVAVRLVEVKSGYVIWTDTYNSPFPDVLAVQDKIAGSVTRALLPSLHVGAETPKL
ncbi:transcriptional regulator [Silvibacterium dinghuense]|uniref:Transcriptional regulator n=2 Tax=Silvibacterium dinghuense TaxID=1560006 RepID=A0A4Q1SHU3_9BACT|nr:winged helix-turn-helix domain-containing protein [Silvibacterium dinghuense]RXS97144.1 transcriptional regulator [Silvibacterium dinghuense]